MDIFGKIAEMKIVRAMEQGEFENLSGAGRPLVVEDETWVPEDLRAAYRILRNSGHIPPELELRNEILSLRTLMERLDDDHERLKKLREMNGKLMKLSMMREHKPLCTLFPGYGDRVCEKLLNGERRDF